MKKRMGLLALALAVFFPTWGLAQAFRLVYGSGLRGEIEPCG